ncbi:inovirus-type Gp2 protein [Pseudomonas sp. MH9.2]|uniref:YagK/YfjJ domain-containing protein n=1 Tax=unclassified Pseudomonas TaxID=196821 RepID=UPI002AC9353F|nr:MULTISPECIES: inovirus-type Gp2 protein [unclassified Pseudomonas]MEB0027397.1 inovirus-type Gp2 protein [Pseudomonas sp. MH9.2]MEB0148704.1 inovirus-type Gp2 protein [Pseudomonas sp. CCC2.2]MEE3506601.1 inovirus-type Gp2 protein [Pseudomonas sp. 10C3]WPX68798.1 inovirus-type Gp2 protein [Pseudomonas sp. MH9.2]
MYSFNTTVFASFSQSQASIRIERLVQSIERTDKPAFEIIQTQSGYERVQRTRISKYVDSMQQMFDLFDDRHPYGYSEHLQAFWEACQDIGLERSPAGVTCLNVQGTAYLDFYHAMNVLVARIRQLISSKRYKRKADDRRYEASRKQATLSEYVSQVLDRYSRTVVVRVDLHYRAMAWPRLRIEHVFNDLDKLIRARERNPIFEHETGYICSVEHGEDKGFHIHAAFFFNGAGVRSDFAKARKIGELWEQITCGLGYFFSCNDDKDRYGDELGIGVIKRADSEACRKVINAVSYLTKDNQYLRMKPVGARAYRTGRIHRATV